MGRISQHFARSEFACNCGCGFDVIDYDLLTTLERIRRLFRAQIKINSGARCLKYNRSIGSKDTSQHVLGKAADIEVKGISPDEVADFAEKIMVDRGGIGRYTNFVHIDSRDKKARW